MKKILQQKNLTLILFLFMLICMQLGSAQDLQWKHSITAPTSGSLEILSIATDASGNVYYGGRFGGTYDFDPGPATENFTAGGSRDAFIQKVDAAGNYLWTKQIMGTPSPASTIQQMNLEVKGGNIVIGATSVKGMDLDPGPGSFDITSTSSAIFILELDGNGDFVFAKQITGSGSAGGSGLEVDGSDNLIIVGSFSGTVDFDPNAGTQNETAEGSSDPMIIKLDQTGNYITSQAFGGVDSDNFSGLDIDGSGNIWAVGSLRGSLTFAPGVSVTVAVAGTRDNFILKLASDLTPELANSWGGGILSATDIAVDPNSVSGDVFVTGFFQGAIDFDPGVGISSLTSSGVNDIYLSKFDNLGNFVWANKFGTSENEISRTIGIDGQGTIHLGGSSGLSSNPSIYYSTVASSGTLIEEYSISGGAINDIVVDSQVVNIGGHTSGGNFELCSGSNLINRGAFGANYLAEFSADLPGINTSSAVICDNGSVTLSIGLGNLNSATNWEWYSGSCDGTSVGSGTSVVVSPVTTTTYFVRGEGYSCIANGDCASITITVSDPPTDIALTSTTIDEGVSTNTTVGSLSTTDVTSGDTHTYSLVKGTGDDDNTSFVIVGNKLRSNEIFDFEVKNTYSIRVRSIDALGCTFEEVFSISVNNVTPEVPTDIALDNSSINENESVNSLIGTFSTTDDDTGEAYTYTLTSGTGDDDNAIFTISNDELANNSVFDFETKSSYTIRVETNDGNGGLFEKQFTISINNVIETENEILSFSIPSQSGSTTVNATNHTVQLDMGFNADKSNLIPTITLSSGATISPLSNVAQDFSSEFTYTVTSESGVAQDWTVKVFATIPAGTYTVGTGGDYADLVTAFSDFDSNGIDGDITLSILDGHTEGLVGISGGWLGEDTYTVTVEPTAGATAITLERLSLTSVKNVVFDGKNIVNLSLDHPSRSSIFTSSNSENLIFRNLHMDNTSGSAVWFFDSNNIEVNGCTYTFGGAIPDQSIIVYRVNNSANVSYIGNTIILGPEYNSSIRSIIVFYTQADTYIANNAVHASPTSAKRFQGVTPNANYYHNTMILNGSGTVEEVTMIRNNSSTSSTVVNNSFYLDIDHVTATGILTANGTSTLDNNNLYIPDADGIDTHLFSVEGTTYGPSDLSAIESVAPESTYSQPFFTDLAGSNLSLTGTSLSDPNLKGQPVAQVTTDINGKVRSTLAPTKGAFEHDNTFALISDISFPEQSGDEVIDDVNFTITAEAVANTDVTDLSPIVIASPGASISPLSGSSQDFSSSVVYTVTAETGGSTQPWTISIMEINETPTDISLSSTSVDENEASGTTVGVFSTTDANTSQSHTYQFVGGSGDTDNSAFTLDGNELKTGSSFDFETDNSYSVRVQTDDGNGGLFEREFAIAVSNVFETPTDLSLSASAIDENNSINAAVGTLSTTDEDAGETYTYSLVAGSGDTDNGSFNISGNQLRASQAFDFETKNSFSVRLQTDDGNGGTLAKQFNISVNDVSETPTDLDLSGSSLVENNTINEVIGTLATTDEDVGETYTYTLVSGSGDTENASFNISGNEVRASEVFDFETQNNYSIRVQTNDGNGGNYQESFSISISNQSEVPTDLLLSSSDIDESSPSGTTVGSLSTEDEDNGETYTYSLVSGTGGDNNASFNIVGNDLRSSEIFDFETKTSYTVRVETNDGTGGTFQKAFTINVNNLPPGLTGISITSSTIDESMAAGSAVGNLFALGDEIDGVSFTFSLVTGSGDTDNASFSIVGGQLRSTISFDFESKNQYSIRVMADDGAGSTIDQVLLIDINDVNESPTDIQLSAASINENNSVNDLIGTFSTTDVDAGDSHSWSLVSGSGDDDNASFNISGNQLQASESFDFEIQFSYSLRVQTSDGNGGTYEEIFSISITDQNDEPTALSLDVSSIDENNALNETIGSFTTSDQDSGDSFTYSLVSGSGDTDNGSFIVSGNQLQAGIFFNFESKENYSVRIQTNDGNGGLFEQSFTITINDVNENPSDILLTGSTIGESNPVGTAIGSLSSIDEDSGQSHTYSLVSGAGDTDNASFTISGNEILSAEVFDFETRNSYSIRVRSEDGNGGIYEEVFTISIIDLPASITAFNLSGNSVDENQASGTSVGTFSTSGEDLSGNFTYDLISGTGDTDNGSFTISGNQLLTNASFDFESKSSYSILVMTDGGNQSDEKVFMISVNDLSEVPTDLELSTSSINENNAIGDAIGSFTTTDEDAGETYTYMLVSGSGDTDNAAFSISGNELQAAEVFDFETQSDYSIRVQTSDGNGGIYQEEFSVTVTDSNENNAPVLTSPLVDYTTINGVVLATRNLASAFTDPDGDAITLTASSSDESVITVEFDGFTLRMNEVGVGQSEVTVTANDGNGGMTSASFLVTIDFVAQAAPTAIALNNTSIDENQPVNTVVAEISRTDVNIYDEAVYTLVPGVGDTDNASFNISTFHLKSNEVFDFEVKSSYSIRLQADDQNGGTFQQSFTISINDLTDNGAPVVAIVLADLTEVEGFGTTDVDLTNTFSDVDGDVLTFSATSSDETVATVAISGNTLTLTETGIGTTTISITTNDGNGGTVSEEFIFIVNEVANNSPIVVNPISDKFSEEGSALSQFSYADTFSDPDGDDLTVSATSSDESVVTMEVVLNEQITVTVAGVGISTITVTADDGNGGTVSDTFTYTITEAALGLNEAFEVSVYPNPVVDFLTVQAERDVNVRLTSMEGVILKKSSGRDLSMDLRDLSSGVYILLLENEGTISQRRIIKAN